MKLVPSHAVLGMDGQSAQTLLGILFAACVLVAVLSIAVNAKPVVARTLATMSSEIVLLIARTAR